MASHDIPQQIANGAAGASIGSGAYHFMSQNTDIVALGFTASMFFVALTFYILNYRVNRKRLLITIEAAAASKDNYRLSDEDLIEVKAFLKKKRRVKKA